jgi:hypothetical protein|tara:strand:- start:371 stop:667 length:297 start_codon:yes stop_codon:yes gene_type:complete
MSGEPTDPTIPILTGEAKMLTDMITKLDEQLAEVAINRLKLVTVRDALVSTLGIDVEQLELPLPMPVAEDEPDSKTDDGLEEAIHYYVDTPDAEKVSP